MVVAVKALDDPLLLHRFWQSERVQFLWKKYIAPIQAQAKMTSVGHAGAKGKDVLVPAIKSPVKFRREESGIFVPLEVRPHPSKDTELGAQGSDAEVVAGQEGVVGKRVGLRDIDTQLPLVSDTSFTIGDRPCQVRGGRLYFAGMDLGIEVREAEASWFEGNGLEGDAAIIVHMRAGQRKVVAVIRKGADLRGALHHELIAALRIRGIGLPAKAAEDRLIHEMAIVDTLAAILVRNPEALQELQKRGLLKGANLQAELNQLVRENPGVIQELLDRFSLGRLEFSSQEEAVISQAIDTLGPDQAVVVATAKTKGKGVASRQQGREKRKPKEAEAVAGALRETATTIADAAKAFPGPGEAKRDLKTDCDAFLAATMGIEFDSRGKPYRGAAGEAIREIILGAFSRIVTEINSYYSGVNPDQAKARAAIKRAIDECVRALNEAARKAEEELAELKAGSQDQAGDKGGQPPASVANSTTDKPPTTDQDSGRSTSTPAAKGALGGIDFRALPIVTQPISQGQAPVLDLGRAVTGLTPMGAQTAHLSNFNLEEEWQRIMNMVKGGIIPSCQRIKEYLQASCLGPDCQERINKVLSCIADILRLEEERVSSTEPALREVLVLLESDKPADELRVALSRIEVKPKEPKRNER
jgi:hypothetical protein